MTQHDEQTDEQADEQAADSSATENGKSKETGDGDTETGENANAEAAKYRRRLRDAEKQRDELAARVTALQRRQAEAMLPAAVKPAAVWAVTELADVLDDDGSVDAAKLDAAVTAAREHFGITKPAKGTHVPGVGNQPDGRPRADGWKQAFTPSRKR